MRQPEPVAYVVQTSIEPYSEQSTLQANALAPLKEVFYNKQETFMQPPFMTFPAPERNSISRSPLRKNQSPCPQFE